MQSYDVKTRDGRTLQVRDSKIDGFPIVYLHGTPGAAVDFQFMIEACHDARLRLIMYSREGYGGSSRRKGRKVVDIVSDVEDVLKHNNIDRCLVMGWSGGGPHALACAARLKGCIGSLVLATTAPYHAEGLDYYQGMGEDNIVETKLALEGEEATRKHVEKEAAQMKGAGPKEIIELMDSILPEVDRATFTNEFGAELANSFHEALRVSADGWIDDNLAFVAEWGFGFDEIKTPVLLFHGSEDLMCPYGHGKYVASKIPKEHATIRFYEGEGHISIVIGKFAEAIKELKDLAKID